MKAGANIEKEMMERIGRGDGFCAGLTNGDFKRDMKRVFNLNYGFIVFTGRQQAKTETFRGKAETLAGLAETFGGKAETLAGLADTFGGKADTLGGLADTFGGKADTLGGLAEMHFSSPFGVDLRAERWGRVK